MIKEAVKKIIQKYFLCSSNITIKKEKFKLNVLNTDSELSQDNIFVAEKQNLEKNATNKNMNQSFSSGSSVRMKLNKNEKKTGYINNESSKKRISKINQTRDEEEEILSEYSDKNEDSFQVYKNELKVKDNHSNKNLYMSSQHSMKKPSQIEEFINQSDIVVNKHSMTRNKKDVEKSKTTNDLDNEITGYNGTGSKCAQNIHLDENIYKNTTKNIFNSKCSQKTNRSSITNFSMSQENIPSNRAENEYTDTSIESTEEYEAFGSNKETEDSRQNNMIEESKKSNECSLETYLLKDEISEITQDQESETEISCSIDFYDKKQFNKILLKKLTEVLKKRSRKDDRVG